MLIISALLGATFLSISLIYVSDHRCETCTFNLNSLLYHPARAGKLSIRLNSLFSDPSLLVIQPDLRSINCTFNLVYDFRWLFPDRELTFPLRIHRIPVTCVVVAIPDLVWNPNGLSLACRITSRFLLNLRQGIREGPGQRTSRMSIGTDWNLTTRFSGDIMSVIIGNIGENFEEEDPEPVSLNSWSVETRRSWSTESLESGYESKYSLGGPDVIVVESIEVSEMRMERPKAIYWEKIRAAGVNS
jgi:hypothetical protein